MDQRDQEIGRLEFELKRQAELRHRSEERLMHLRDRTRLMHLRDRTRELLRRLPVDLPPMAANMRMIVAALVSETTEKMQRDEDNALFREGYVRDVRSEAESAPGRELRAHSNASADG